MRVVIVGLGLMGGSLAKDLRSTGFASEIIGIDSNPLHQSEALQLSLVDQTASFEPAVPEADLVVLAVPVNSISGLLLKALDLLKPGGAITDMGSTKFEIAKSVEKHPRRNSFVASHPMAGTEHSGPQAALSNLFRGKTAVICDRNLSGSQELRLVEELYTAIGARLIYMNSYDHDLHVAYVSHLSHISSFVLANTVLDKEKDQTTIFDLASGGFESTVRLAKSSPAMWAPIFEQNRDFVIEALNSYIDHLERFRESIARGDLKQTHILMENANQIRRILTNITPAPTEKKR